MHSSELITTVVAVVAVENKYKEAQLLLESTRRVLVATNKLRWDTTKQIAKSLRYILNMRRRWLEIRKEFVELHDLTVALDRNLTTACSVEARAYSNLKRGQRQHGDRIVPASTFKIKCVSPENYTRLFRAMQTVHDFQLALDIYYNQSQFLCQLPEYMAIKKLMPQGGRDGYSACLAAINGCLTDTLPSENKLFGWNYNYHEAARNLRRVARAISNRLREPRGKAPSYEAGRNILKATIWATPQSTVKNLKDYTFSQRAEFIRVSQIRFSPGENGSTAINLQTAALCGEWHKAMPAILKFISRPRDYGIEPHKPEQWKKMCFKVMGLAADQQRVTNDVFTVLTGPPQHLHGADYYAPVLYTVEKRGGYGTVSCRTERGYILMRNNWPDVYHVSTRNFDPTLKQAAVGAGDTLDQASRSYFERRLEEAREKVSKGVRFARMLRVLRSLKYVEFKRGDSYSVGNCQPGTEAFINTLRISSDTNAAIPGPLMARLWYKANYPQPDRFNSVIKLLQTKQQDYLQKCWDAADALYPPEYLYTDNIPAVPEQEIKLFGERSIDWQLDIGEWHSPNGQPIEGSYQAGDSVSIPCAAEGVLS